jgi:hypothetical protein
MTDVGSARTATHQAGGAAAAVAGLTALIATINLVSDTSIMGLNAWSYLDASLFGLVAWRVWCGSRAWAVTGLALYVLEVTINVVTHPPGVSILTIIILAALINGVRGTFALHKFREWRKQEEMAAAQQMAYQAGATQGYLSTAQGYMPTTAVPPPPPPVQPK